MLYITFTIKKDKQRQQILTIKKLEYGNVWQFCLKYDQLIIRMQIFVYRASSD